MKLLDVWISKIVFFSKKVFEKMIRTRGQDRNSSKSMERSWLDVPPLGAPVVVLEGHLSSEFLFDSTVDLCIKSGGCSSLKDPEPADFPAWEDVPDKWEAFKR